MRTLAHLLHEPDFIKWLEYREKFDKNKLILAKCKNVDYEALSTNVKHLVSQKKSSLYITGALGSTAIIMNMAPYAQPKHLVAIAGINIFIVAKMMEDDVSNYGKILEQCINEKSPIMKYLNVDNRMFYPTSVGLLTSYLFTLTVFHAVNLLKKETKNIKFTDRAFAPHLNRSMAMVTPAFFMFLLTPQVFPGYCNYLSLEEAVPLYCNETNFSYRNSESVESVDHYKIENIKVNEEDSSLENLADYFNNVKKNRQESKKPESKSWREIADEDVNFEYKESKLNEKLKNKFKF